jgi:hypothetical protein
MKSLTVRRLNINSLTHSDKLNYNPKCMGHLNEEYYLARKPKINF